MVEPKHSRTVSTTSRIVFWSAVDGISFSSFELRCDGWANVHTGTDGMICGVNFGNNTKCTLFYNKQSIFKLYSFKQMIASAIVQIRSSKHAQHSKIGHCPFRLWNHPVCDKTSQVLLSSCSLPCTFNDSQIATHNRY